MKAIKIKVKWTNYIEVYTGKSYFYGVVNIYNNSPKIFTNWDDVVNFLKTVTP